MRILIVTDTIPFPPQNGRELPLSHLVESLLSPRFEVDILVISSEIDGPDDQRLRNVPPNVGNLFRLSAEAVPAAERLTRELAGIRPGYYLQGFSLQEVEDILAGTDYDLAWITPIRCLGLVDQCRQNNITLARRIAIGLNDVKTTLYYNVFREGTARRSFDLSKIRQGLRIPVIWHYERRYFNEADLIHVQTPLEAQRAVKLYGPEVQSKIVIAPNGRKVELEQCTYAGIDTPVVLYMTQLRGGREKEAKWFVREVWPEIRRSRRDAVLWLVGPPPEPGSWVLSDLPDGVVIRGFVDDLAELFDQIRLAVVPITHSTGLINRVVDAMVAGVPLVSSPEALATVPDLAPGQHALAASTKEEYVNAILQLFDNRRKREELAQNAAHFGRQLPDWDSSVSTVMDAVESVSGRDASSPGARTENLDEAR